MKRKNLIKCINNYDSIFELLTNDPDVYEKLNDEFDLEIDADLEIK